MLDERRPTFGFATKNGEFAERFGLEDFYFPVMRPRDHRPGAGGRGNPRPRRRLAFRGGQGAPRRRAWDRARLPHRRPGEGAGRGGGPFRRGRFPFAARALDWVGNSTQGPRCLDLHLRMAILAVALATTAGAARAEEVGEVTTTIKILGANHKIVVEAFDDPKVEGVACFISRARTGGITGSLGIAEDTSDAAVSCQQTGPVRFREELEDGEEVYSARGPASSSSTSRWCASMTRTATRWSISPIRTSSSTARRRTASRPW